MASPLLHNAWVINVGSALAVTVIVTVLGYYFDLARRLFFRNVPDISGTWDSYDSLDPGSEPVGRWRIRQVGPRVSVEITRIRNREGSPMQRKFVGRGRWQAEQLTCIFRDESAQHRCGAIVLRRRTSAVPIVLSGRTIYYDTSPRPGDRRRLDGAGIASHPYSIRKQNN